jgi:hypothetical protein
VSKHAIAIQMWDGPIVVKLAGAIPTQATLDEIARAYTARNCGVRPNVRVLGQLTIPAYENAYEPVCEELQPSGALDHGRRRGMAVQRQ